LFSQRFLVYTLPVSKLQQYFADTDKISRVGKVERRDNFSFLKCNFGFVKC